MAKIAKKEDLFSEYMHAINETLHTFEQVFDVEGLTEQVLGNGTHDEILDRVRKSSAWNRVDTLYDYAVCGIATDHPEDIVIGAAEVIKLLDTENGPSLEEFETVCEMGDGRFALDVGEDLHINTIAFLADVDSRTVRNAISAGELVANKTENGLFVKNASARKWLSGRRGFKPTINSTNNTASLDEIHSPGEFSSLLKNRRSQLSIDNGLIELTPVEAMHFGEVEEGVYTLPISSAFPIADFYQLDRKSFLNCVMRVFFSEQLNALREM